MSVQFFSVFMGHHNDFGCTISERTETGKLPNRTTLCGPCIAAAAGFRYDSEFLYVPIVTLWVEFFCISIL